MLAHDANVSMQRIGGVEEHRLGASGDQGLSDFLEEGRGSGVEMGCNAGGCVNMCARLAQAWGVVRPHTHIPVQ